MTFAAILTFQKQDGLAYYSTILLHLRLERTRRRLERTRRRRKMAKPHFIIQLTADQIRSESERLSSSSSEEARDERKEKQRPPPSIYISGGSFLHSGIILVGWDRQCTKLSSLWKLILDHGHYFDVYPFFAPLSEIGCGFVMIKKELFWLLNKRAAGGDSHAGARECYRI